MTSDLPDLRLRLAEAARYVRSDPAHAEGEIRAVADELRLVAVGDGWYTSDRLAENLDVAAHWLLVEPDVAAGYVAGAVWELGLLVSQAEREGAGT